LVTLYSNVPVTTVLLSNVNNVITLYSKVSVTQILMSVVRT